ncbi:hypothetical protein [Labedaea rhizosphaerae]|uniref:Uncharacterized protein n=1 Tax=Labedaea rhizosphaerae TaxID=598644 RepID=A0A4R6SJV5_LABRH|nr:hypothetical protein [Labedaea rhizosphaerae]TDQ01229.1 hypothetical protein EV186_1021097 [Labedaea rhizosphaerae]
MGFWKDAWNTEVKNMKERFRNAKEEGTAQAESRLAGNSFHGIHVHQGRVHYEKQSVSLAGAEAFVETAGQIERRGRGFLAVGGIGVVLGRSKDNRELYLGVKGTDGAFVVSLDPDKGKQAREFAARINAMAASAGQPPSTS